MLEDFLKQFFAPWLAANHFQLVESFVDKEYFGNELLVYKSKNMSIRFSSDRGYIYVDLSPTHSPNEWFYLTSLLELLGYKKESFIGDSAMRMKNFVDALNKDYPRLQAMLDTTSLLETRRKISALRSLKAVCVMNKNMNYFDEKGFVTTLENCQLLSLTDNQAVLIYNISEVGMGKEYGSIAIVRKIAHKLQVIKAPKILGCFLSGAISGVQVIPTKMMGEIILINYVFPMETEQSESENPFVFFRVKDMMVSVLRLDQACAFRVRDVNNSIIEFEKVHSLRRDLDRRVKKSFVINIEQLDWNNIDLFNTDFQTFNHWYFSLPKPMDRMERI